MKYLLALLIATPAMAEIDYSNIFGTQQPRQGSEIVVIPVEPPTLKNPFPQQYMVFTGDRYELVDPLGKPSGRIGGELNYPALANPYGAGNAAPASKDKPVFNNYILGQGQ
jgi:hypothetical protein